MSALTANLQFVSEFGNSSAGYPVWFDASGITGF